MIAEADVLLDEVRGVGVDVARGQEILDRIRQRLQREEGLKPSIQR